MVDSYAPSLQLEYNIFANEIITLQQRKVYHNDK